jgi:hypothetical protein
MYAPQNARVGVLFYVELLKRFSLFCFLNFYHEPFLGFWVFRVSKINPKQKMSRLSLLSFVVLHTSSSALFCSVAAVLLSLSFSLSSLSSLSIVGSGCWCCVVVASCSSVLGGSLERERENERDEKSKIGIEGSDARRAREEADADDFDADWIAEGDFF